MITVVITRNLCLGTGSREPVNWSFSQYDVSPFKPSQVLIYKIGTNFIRTEKEEKKRPNEECDRESHIQK